MKKVFTFFVALAMVLVAFAQKPNFQGVKLDQPNVNVAKSNWYGNMTTNTVGTQAFTEGVVIVRRFAANELPAGATIEKIMFYAVLSFSGQSYSGEFNVQVYTGGDGSWLEDSSWTSDLDVCGTVVAQQRYTATADGDQTVVLNNPVTIPSGQEVWIAVECLGWACLGFQVEDDVYADSYSMFSLWKKYDTQDEEYYWGSPLWCDDEECEHTHGCEWHLACYVNDGQAYEPINDMVVYFFDPFIEGQNVITEQLITDDYEYDSLYVCFAYFNNGPDSAEMAKMHLTMTIEDEGVSETWLDWDYSQEESVQGRYVKVNYGGIWGNIAEDGLEEALAVIGIEELADYGLSYPFNLCMNLAFNGNDPDLTNNSKCLTYDKPNGLQENANYSVNVYPNPANNVVTIANAAGAQISIYNLAGQEVASVASASANQAINVANLAEGMYVIRVANGNNVSTSKFSVVR